jgi:BRCA1-associated protein
LDSKSDYGRSEMLLMIAVPAAISCRDLLQFVAPFQANIEQIKIIRDSIPNQYMVLIKLKTQVCKIY